MLYFYWAGRFKSCFHPLGPDAEAINGSGPMYKCLAKKGSTSYMACYRSAEWEYKQ